jgi:hypothetical protein
LQDSFKVFGLLAPTAYLITYRATYLGVTNSAKAIKSSLTGYICLTSPILSDKKGISTDTQRLDTLSLVFATVRKRLIDSFIMLIFDSFQSFILALTTFERASKDT